MVHRTLHSFARLTLRSRASYASPVRARRTRCRFAVAVSPRLRPRLLDPIRAFTRFRRIAYSRPRFTALLRIYRPLFAVYAGCRLPSCVHCGYILHVWMPAHFACFIPAGCRCATVHGPTTLVAILRTVLVITCLPLSSPLPDCSILVIHAGCDTCARTPPISAYWFALTRTAARLFNLTICAVWHYWFSHTPRAPAHLRSFARRHADSLGLLPLVCARVLRRRYVRCVNAATQRSTAGVPAHL